MNEMKIDAEKVGSNKITIETAIFDEKINKED